jgi:hypothetical protein
MLINASRRDFLARSAFGIGTFALAHLLQRDGLLGQEGGRPGENLPLNLQSRRPHFASKANAMISLFMHGGPSQMDLLDPKPVLRRLHGSDYSGGDFTFSFVNQASRKLLGSPFKFARRGQCGTEISELLPHTAEIVDEICVLRSMHTGQNGHGPSIAYFNYGIPVITGRPTMGSWIIYGLGSEADNLPAYMVLSDPGGYPTDGILNWSSGFMPSLYQGIVLRPQEPRIFNLDAPRHLRGPLQEQNLDFLRELNRRHAQQHPGEADLESRIASFELAARMQESAREALDLSTEPASIRRLYGLDQAHTRSYGERCLIARRLVERGVRFVQLFMSGQPWDHHDNLRRDLPGMCRQTDQPSAALVKDLKQRGLLDSTIVHWGGEFGRLPVVQGAVLNDSSGRDHNGQGFSMWLAGGGIKGGMTFGNTDEIGHRAVEDIVTPNDYHATILHLFGFDPTRLVYHHNGREQRITDGRPARVLREIIHE